MSVESTIQGLLAESRKLQGIAEETLKPAPEVAEPSNAKNNKTDEKEAEGGTSKKPNVVTQGAAAPEGTKKLSEDEQRGELVIDMTEDVNALFNGEDGLTEEFRNKATTIFEAAVTSRIKAEVARINEELVASQEAALQEKFEEVREGLVEAVDGYLNLMVEQWLEQNEVALESGMKSDILEGFVGGLKTLFEQHYIEVPEERFDIVGEMESKIGALSTKLDEAVALNVSMKKQLDENTRSSIVATASEGLSVVEKDKLTTLAEEIVFDDADSFAAKLQNIRESYFNKKPAKATQGLIVEEAIEEAKEVPAHMSKYVSALDTVLKK
jgi:hypothetical protein